MNFPFHLSGFLLNKPVHNKETPHLMLAQNNCLQDIKELRELVYITLCNHEQLEPGVFPMTERILLRGGKPCGVYFCLHGPRSVKYTSIWETDKNTILFYGATGERFRKTRLKAAPALHG